MRRATLLLALAGCAEGPDPDSLVKGLTVLAAALEPPRITPGEPFDAVVTVADPDGGAVVGAWTCQPEACASASAPLEGDAVTLTLTPEAPGVLWLLACSPGTCDPGALDEADRRDPVPFLRTMPLEGVSLASRALVPPDGEIAPNPVIEEAPALPDTTSADPVDLRFSVPGAATARGWATAGGFARATVDVASDGEAVLSWYPPEEGEARAWVVFSDEQGGVAVWSSSAP